MPLPHPVLDEYCPREMADRMLRKHDLDGTHQQFPHIDDRLRAILFDHWDENRRLTDLMYMTTSWALLTLSTVSLLFNIAFISHAIGL